MHHAHGYTHTPRTPCTRPQSTRATSALQEARRTAYTSCACSQSMNARTMHESCTSHARDTLSIRSIMCAMCAKCVSCTACVACIASCTPCTPCTKHACDKRAEFGASLLSRSRDSDRTKIMILNSSYFAHMVHACIMHFSCARHASHT
jgi:hypothetical protein